MTETKHTLPSGATVTLCEPSQVPEKYIRRARNRGLDVSPELRAYFSTMGQSEPSTDMLTLFQPGDADILEEVNDLTASALIVAWSFDHADGKHPTPDDITELSAADYRKLQELVAPHAAALLQGEDFGPVPHQVNPNTPTEPSSA